MSNPRWQGIFPAVTTKFHADERIDAEGTARHIDFQIRNGIHGLVTCGSLGEASTLTLEEKLEVARIALDAAGGRVPVLANVSETSTREAQRYIDGANQLGVAGFMVMPSVIYVADAREAMANVRAMAQAAQKPLMVYNNPVAYRVDLKPEHMQELADCEWIAAIKESSGDIRRINGGPDRRTARGEDIPIEERDPVEVLAFRGTPITGEDVKGYYPAFDLAPRELVTGIVTSRGIETWKG